MLMPEILEVLEYFFNHKVCNQREVIIFAAV